MQPSTVVQMQQQVYILQEPRMLFLCIHSSIVSEQKLASFAVETWDRAPITPNL